MKELTIEQKAQRYDEALTKARNIVNSINVGLIGKDSFEAVFPELKEDEESRDEKIRKKLLSSFKGIMADADEDELWYGLPYNDILAWLEKQSTPQVRTGLEWVNTIDDACDKRYAEEYAHGEYCHEQSFKWGFFEGVDWLEKQGRKIEPIDGFNTELERQISHLIASVINKEYEYTEWFVKWVANSLLEYSKHELEKQGEQNTSNNETKFHEGEWITNGDYTWKIVEVKPLDYILQSQDGNIVDDTISHVDEQFHSFTVEDAKDGDVLACESGWTCIFKTLVNDETFSSYCFMDKMKRFYEKGSGCHTIKDEMVKAYNGEIKPATKEQRDLLFQKMKEAGYVWDADKKELKKVESKFKAGDWVVVSTTKGDRVVQISSVEYFKDGYPSYITTEGRWFGNGTKARLLTDKDVETITIPESKIVVNKNKEWSEEDEYYYGIIQYILNNECVGKTDKENAITWFKSLKGRVQPKQECSEEDEKIKESIITGLEMLKDGASDQSLIALYNKKIDWLKSIRPQWKPSDEQMKTLEYYMHALIATKHKEVLFGLYNDLKQL